MRNCFESECLSYMGSCGGLYEGGHGVAYNSAARGESIIKRKVTMMEIVIPYIIIAWAFLKKLSLLWPSSMLVLCDMAHFFGSFINLLLKFS